MGEDGKMTIKIPETLADAIDPFLSCKDEFGIPLWESKSRFVVAATQFFLKQNAPLLQMKTVKVGVKA